MVNNKIQKLKDLRVAYECAINYDYVPDKEEAEELISDILPDHLNIKKKELEKILDEYEGNSDGNIRDLIIDLIDEL